MANKDYYEKLGKLKECSTSYVNDVRNNAKNEDLKLDNKNYQNAIKEVKEARNKFLLNCLSEEELKDVNKQRIDHFSVIYKPNEFKAEEFFE